MEHIPQTSPSRVARLERTDNSSLGTVLIFSLFFLWALTANLLPVLIPHLKKACKLNVLESSLIDAAYWIAYFVVAIPAGLVIRRFGYRITIIAGLVLASIGAGLFYPAASAMAYGFFLLALFVLASGMAFLETAANPFITLLGRPATAVRRLNFAQAFNGLGAFIAAMFLGKLIIGKNIKTEEALGSLSPDALRSYYESLFHQMKFPYMMIAAVLLLVAVLFTVTKFSVSRKDVSNERRLRAKLKLDEHPQLTGGIIAQFFYVGAQVCISSFFILYVVDVVKMNEYAATNYLGLLLLGFMLGRYAGAFIMNYIDPSKLLFICAVINISLLLFIVFMSGGYHTTWIFIGVEFFMSIMYPTIFSLAIKGLGDKTPLASSYIVMAITGGALFPLLLGYLADVTGSIQTAYAVPLLCFVPVAWYGWSQQRIKATTLASRMAQ